MAKLNARAQVIRFAREEGLTISPKPGNTPLIGKDEWFKVFDSWQDALQFFVESKWNHVDKGEPWPWNTRGEEYKLGKMTRDLKTGVVTQHAANPTKRKTARKLNPKPLRKLAKPKPPPKPFYYVLKSPHYDGVLLSTHYSIDAVKKIAQEKADKYGTAVKITEFHS